MSIHAGGNGQRANTRDATADAGITNAPLAILAPTARDSAVAAAVLGRAGFAFQICGDIDALCASINDHAGVLVVAREALTGPARATLLDALDAQPPWSDIPLVVLTGESELSRALSAGLHALATRANVTLLERPVRVATLVTTLRAALRARQRQFDVRDHLSGTDAE